MSPAKSVLCRALSISRLCGHRMEADHDPPCALRKAISAPQDKLMRRSLPYTFALATLSAVPFMLHAQQAPPMGGMHMEEKATPIADGGIFVPGWMGKVDEGAEKAGQTVKDSRLAKDGADLHITTGPAITYWNPSMKGTGDYTVSATFNEPKYMNRNSHPHPYGIVIAGNEMGTPEESELYCAAYGNGRFIVRGFSPASFQLNGRGEANDAVHKASGPGEPVSQKIAMQVKGDKVSCIINDVTVGSYDKSAVVGDGKLKTLDGVAGIRFAHNTDATVSDFKVTK